MLYALMLYLAFHRKKENCNLDTLLDTVSIPADDLQVILDEVHETPYNKAVRRAIGKVLSIKSEKTQGSIIGGAQDALGFMDLEQMARVTSGHDFELSDLKNDKVTVYLILPVEHLETCAGWLRLMVARTLSVMSEMIHIPEKPVLFLLDEAARLGRIDSLAKAPAALRGYGVRVWPIFQGMGQIQHLYKNNEWRDFIANSTVQIFGINDNDTAKYFSEHIGTHGMVIETFQQGTSFNDQGMKGASAGKSAGSNTAIHKRQLMTIDEINRMPDHEQLIILAGKRPARLGKARYYDIPEFAGKFDKNPFYRGDN